MQKSKLNSRYVTASIAAVCAGVIMVLLLLGFLVVLMEHPLNTNVVLLAIATFLAQVILPIAHMAYSDYHTVKWQLKQATYRMPFNKVQQAIRNYLESIKYEEYPQWIVDRAVKKHKPMR